MTTKSTPLRLYLVRHGETEWSLSGQHTGTTDLPLTTRGEEEARDLIPWLRQIDFDLILTSPRQRARQTCEIALSGRAAEVEPDLAEWDYGDYEGKRSVDIRRNRPDWNIFRDGCPQGETPAQIAERADRLIGHLCAIGGSIALFSHGQFGMALVARWIRLPVVAAEHFQIGTASLSILGFAPSHPDTRVIALWNASPALFAKSV
jgi:broad specificity phosphatase PhoE